MTTNTYSEILYAVSDRQARITLNRPQKRNAITYQMQKEMNHALWEADNDTAVHCVVISGAGGNFSSGYDVSPGTTRFPNLGPQDSGKQYRNEKYYESFEDDLWTLQRGQDLRMAIFDMHKPVIAEVRGYCYAGGTDIALLCDMIIAAEDAEFAFPPVRDMGCPPAHMWLYHLGPQWTKRMLLTGDTLLGKDAAQLGLILKSVPGDVLTEEVNLLTKKLGLIDTDLLAANKRIINLGLEMMGARTLQRSAIDADARGHLSSSAVQYRALAKSGGLKAAVQERNKIFGSRPIRVNEPEVSGDD